MFIMQCNVIIVLVNKSIGVGSGGPAGHWPKCIDFATKFWAIFNFAASLSKCLYIF